MPFDALLLRLDRSRTPLHGRAAHKHRRRLRLDMAPSSPVANIADVPLTDAEPLSDLALCSIGASDGPNRVFRQFGVTMPVAFDGAAVLRLFPSGCPSAVVRRIAARVVDALKGVLFSRAWTHVGKEGREVMSPSVADANPATAVVAVVLGAWIFATVDHAGPRVVLTRPTMTRSMPADVSVLGDSIQLQASATTGITTNKVGPQDSSDLTALTTAQPSGFAADDTVTVQDCQARELAAREINQSHVETIEEVGV